MLLLPCWFCQVVTVVFHCFIAHICFAPTLLPHQLTFLVGRMKLAIFSMPARSNQLEQTVF